MQNIYIAIAIIALAIVAVLAVYNRRRWQSKKLSRLAILAFVFILGGLIFGDNQIIGYSFLGLGTLFAVIDIIRNLKSKSSIPIP